MRKTTTVFTNRKTGRLTFKPSKARKTCTSAPETKTCTTARSLPVTGWPVDRPMAVSITEIAETQDHMKLISRHSLAIDVPVRTANFCVLKEDGVALGYRPGALNFDTSGVYVGR